MRSLHKVPGAALLLASAAWACAPSTPDAAREGDQQQVTEPYVMASSPEAAGRHLVITSGCNDCHTAGWIESAGEVPESQWLMGNPIGWRGPWGTTYPPNLRLAAQRLTEDEWVEMLHTRTERPPMPWPGLHHFSDADLRALYQYIRTLQPTGDPAPTYLPPGEVPPPPYFVLVVPPPAN